MNPTTRANVAVLAGAPTPAGNGPALVRSAGSRAFGSGAMPLRLRLRVARQEPVDAEDAAATEGRGDGIARIVGVQDDSRETNEEDLDDPENEKTPSHGPAHS